MHSVDLCLFWPQAGRPPLRVERSVFGHEKFQPAPLWPGSHARGRRKSRHGPIHRHYAVSRKTVGSLPHGRPHFGPKSRLRHGSGDGRLYGLNGPNVRYEICRRPQPRGQGKILRHLQRDRVARASPEGRAGGRIELDRLDRRDGTALAGGFCVVLQPCQHGRQEGNFYQKQESGGFSKTQGVCRKVRIARTDKKVLHERKRSTYPLNDDSGLNPSRKEQNDESWYLECFVRCGFVNSVAFRWDN
mmetsp:Transcript_10758/g.27204  ORF Transcript_10758/g.27204 Transcript_10758/m.27204 type:complete len:245 (-) Transcript_10758:135-869(-)